MRPADKNHNKFPATGRIIYLDRTLQTTDLDLEIQTLNYISEVGEERTKKIPGWPIIVRKASWKSSLVVGLWQNLSQITMIDNQAIKWASKIVVQSLQIQYLPSCRGPGKSCYITDIFLFPIITFRIP